MLSYYILGIIAVVLLWIAGAYNGLIRLVNRTKEAWSDIDVQLKRRYDLIPNLMNTVKGFADQEKGVFQNVSDARARAMGSNGVEEKGKAENMLSGALKSVFALAEAYPQLKSDQNFLKLQHDLTDTENQIESSRRYYNGNVRELNTALETFPRNMIAGMFGFLKSDFFQAESSEKENVSVKF
jgi:LemA protein